MSSPSSVSNAMAVDSVPVVSHDEQYALILLVNTGNKGPKTSDYSFMFQDKKIKVIFTDYKEFHEIQHKDSHVVTERKWYDGRKLALADEVFMAELTQMGLPIYYLADDVSFSLLRILPSSEEVNTRYPGSCVKDTLEQHVFKNNLLALAKAMEATHGIYRCTIAIGPIEGQPVVVHGEVKVKITEAVGTGFIDHQVIDGNGRLISSYTPEDRFREHPRGIAVQETLPLLPL